MILTACFLSLESGARSAQGVAIVAFLPASAVNQHPQVWRLAVAGDAERSEPSAGAAKPRLDSYSGTHWNRRREKACDGSGFGGGYFEVSAGLEKGVRLLGGLLENLGRQSSGHKKKPESRVFRRTLIVVLTNNG